MIVFRVTNTQRAMLSLQLTIFFMVTAMCDICDKQGRYPLFMCAYSGYQRKTGSTKLWFGTRFDGQPLKSIRSSETLILRFLS